MQAFDVLGDIVAAAMDLLGAMAEITKSRYSP